MPHPILTYPTASGVTAFTTKRSCDDCALASLGVTGDNKVKPHQTHGTEIRQIAKDFLALPADIRKMVLDGVDAVMTDVEGICIGVSTADCVPILLYDADRKVVCAIHSGWRGTAARLVEKAISAMVLTYRINPVNLKAIIGPSISLEAFEVGDEVYDQFANAAFPMDRVAVRKDKWHIDLQLCNRLQLENMGVREANIHDAAICTYFHNDEYFSARRDGAKTGRNFNGIMLKASQ